MLGHGEPSSSIASEEIGLTKTTERNAWADKPSSLVASEDEIGDTTRPKQAVLCIIIMENRCFYRDSIIRKVERDTPIRLLPIAE
jgi:hypothetical protein